jgi:hypothetical protein
MNAVVITGQFRCFDRVFKSLVSNIIIPNNAVVFICCEVDDPTRITRLLETYPEVKVGGALLGPSFRDQQFNSILHMIKTSGRKGVSNEVFERSKRHDGINWSFSYLEGSGTIIQYYQFWKVWSMVLDYERANKVKFTNIMRTRTDTQITRSVNLANVFEDGGYVKKLYTNDKLVVSSSYFENLSTDVDDDTLVTLGHEQVWIGKHATFDKLSNIIFEYGIYDSGLHSAFNSETQFHQFCKKRNIKHLGILEKDWPLYTFSQQEVDKYLFSIERF